MTAQKNKRETIGGGFSVEKDVVRELAALLDETGLSEIEVSEEGRTVRVARPNAALSVNAPAAAGVPPSALEGGAAAGTAPIDTTMIEDLAGHPGAVVSPMVGTVYLAPEPGAAPFVQVGDRVEEGDTLVIVEAMKTMNPIPAPRAGTVARLLVGDAMPVEYGEALLILD